jgi:cytochrome c oxidase cbb3-type subunit 3
MVLVACGGSRETGTPPSVRYAEHVSAGGNAPPATELTNPFAKDSGAVGDGARIFSTMNCDGCHGAGATGWVGPSLVDGRWRYGGSDGSLYQSIFYGRPRGMPAFGGVMSEGAIWRVISYIRAQPVPAVVPTQRFTPAVAEPQPKREQTHTP